MLAGEVRGDGWIEILIFRCAEPVCQAIWRLLPHFLARHLWRRWTLVGIVLTTDGAGRHAVPERTKRRWRERLARSAAVLIALLGRSGRDEHVGRIEALGHNATRGELAVAFGGLSALAELAALIHHHEPGVRLM